VSFGPVNIYEI